MIGVNHKEAKKRLQEVIKDSKTKSLRAFALSVNIDPSQLAKVINDQRGLTKSMVESIAKQYNISGDWLLYGEGEKYGQNKTPLPANGHPPAFIPVTWQEYIQLIHLSLEALRAGQSQILNQQARTIAEVRGYGQYQIQREVNWDQEKFVKLMERVGTIIGANLKVDDEQDNS